MKYTYQSRGDNLYIDVRPGAKPRNAQVFEDADGHGVIVDLDAAGNVCGVEVMGAQAIIDNLDNRS